MIRTAKSPGISEVSEKVHSAQRSALILSVFSVQIPNIFAISALVIAS